jgi:enoyl-[acyl-carrier-protein] reductase (NADH)
VTFDHAPINTITATTVAELVRLFGREPDLNVVVFDSANPLPIGPVVGAADVATLAVHIMSNRAVTGTTYDVDRGQQLVG